MLLRDSRSIMQRRWHGQKGDLLSRFGPLVFTMCEIWGVSLREDAFSWGCKTGRKCVQNACEANLRVETQCFCGRVMDGELCWIYCCRGCIGEYFVCAVCLCLQYLHYFCLQVTVEEVMTTTAYLDLFLRSVSEPALLKIFLRFILLHRHENVHILDTLTSRINTPFRVRPGERKFRYSAWM